MQIQIRNRQSAIERSTPAVQRVPLLSSSAPYRKGESTAQEQWHTISATPPARIVDDIPAALAGCVTTFATSAKLGLYRRQAAIAPAEAARLAVEAAARGPVACVFGPEDKGFLTRELLHFDRIGFFFGQSPDKLKYALRHLFGRVDMSVNEADILIGMARQIR